MYVKRGPILLSLVLMLGMVFLVPGGKASAAGCALSPFGRPHCDSNVSAGGNGVSWDDDGPNRSAGGSSRSSGIHTNGVSWDDD